MAGGETICALGSWLAQCWPTYKMDRAGGTEEQGAKDLTYSQSTTPGGMLLPLSIACFIQICTMFDCSAKTAVNVCVY